LPSATTFADSVQDVLKREPAQQAVQRPIDKADQTVMLADVPKDLRSRDEIVLEAGEVFGEMSALSRYPLSTDIVARTDVQCLLIRTSALRLMFKQKDLAEFKKLIDTRYRERTLSFHLKSVGLFAHLGDAAMQHPRQS